MLNMYLSGRTCSRRHCDAGTGSVALWLDCSEEAHHKQERYLSVSISDWPPGNVLSSRCLDTRVGD
jgi:hypothetical protein